MPKVVPASITTLFRAALANHRADQLDEAVDSYRRVIALAPDHGPAHHNLSVVLRRLGRLPEALASADSALALQPDVAGAHNGRGRVLASLGRWDEALASYERAIALAPEDPTFHQNRGDVLRAMGRLADALETFETALALEPNSAVLHLDRGAALHQLGRLTDAVEAFARAAELNPAFIPAHRNMAIVLRSLGRPEEALASVDSALAIQPAEAGLRTLRADLMLDMGRTQEALEGYDSALALDERSAQAHNGRGSALGRLERLDEALAACERAIELDPALAVAHRNRGVVLRKLRRPEDAVAAQDRAIALKPEHPDAYFFRSFCHLLLRRFEAGWRDYERRWEVEEFLRTAGDSATPVLRARVDVDVRLEDIVGRDVLLIGEQGVGDVVMFASMLPDLLAVAGRVALVCDARLHRLSGESFPAVELLEPAEAERRDFAVVTGIGSLGRLFRNRTEDFPGVAYLRPRPTAVDGWAARLGPANGRRRIGLSWRGGDARTGRTARSLDLAQLLPVLRLPGCDFVSLQYGDVAKEVGAINADLPVPIRLFRPDEIDDFEDLASLVRNLDLVVSVQTSLVHLTGALGAPGLVMLPGTPEWRYTAHGETLPWYRSIRLFRQDEEEDWEPVVQAVAAETAARLGLEL